MVLLHCLWTTPKYSSSYLVSYEIRKKERKKNARLSWQKNKKRASERKGLLSLKLQHKHQKKCWGSDKKKLRGQVWTCMGSTKKKEGGPDVSIKGRKRGGGVWRSMQRSCWSMRGLRAHQRHSPQQGQGPGEEGSAEEVEEEEKAVSFSDLWLLTRCDALRPERIIKSSS